MVPLIGSGRFITAPVINEKGEPILDPLVLLEANMGNDPNDPASGSDGGVDPTIVESLQKSNDQMSQKEIQWKLHLHQIGMLRVCSLPYNTTELNLN